MKAHACDGEGPLRYRSFRASRLLMQWIGVETAEDIRFEADVDDRSSDEDGDQPPPRRKVRLKRINPSSSCHFSFFCVC